MAQLVEKCTDAAMRMTLSMALPILFCVSGLHTNCNSLILAYFTATHSCFGAH